MALKLSQENLLVKMYFIKDPLAQYLCLGKKKRFVSDNSSQKYIRFCFRELGFQTLEIF